MTMPSTGSGMAASTSIGLMSVMLALLATVAAAVGATGFLRGRRV